MDTLTMALLLYCKQSTYSFYSITKENWLDHTKDRGSWHLCKVNYMVSSITMYDIWHLLCHIIHKNYNLTIDNYIFVVLCNFFHYLMSNCNFCGLYATINATYWTFKKMKLHNLTCI
jgi:hypothetical protein